MKLVSVPTPPTERRRSSCRPLAIDRRPRLRPLRGLLLGTSILAAASASPLVAQEDTIPTGQGLPVEEGVLEGPALAAFESAEADRSRMCVPVLTRQADLDARLAPISERAARLTALHGAVTVEDSLRVSPFREGDALEAEVRQWFVEDQALALAYLETSDDALQEERNELRRAIRERLQGAFDALNQEASDIVGNDEEWMAAIGQCDGAILIRSAVQEACGSQGGPVCEAARAAPSTAPARYRFVDSARDLWEVEELRPWTGPGRLSPTPDGGIGGARTSAFSRRGNVTLVVSLEPLFQDRSTMTDEEVADFESHLDSLGFDFEHPGVVMAPALSIAVGIRGPVMGENQYLLHFGDLSDPAEQVFWTLPATDEGPLRALFPAPEWVLARLASGEEMLLTAVEFPEDSGDGEGEIEVEARYSLGVTPIGQAQAVTTLLSYMAGGEMATDLAAIIPPEPGTP